MSVPDSFFARQTSPAFNELVLDLNGNKYINCGNVAGLLRRPIECGSRKGRRKIDRISLSTPTEARDLAIASDSCECVRRVRARARERAGSAFCFGGFGLPAAGLMVKQVLWFTRWHIFKASRGRDTAALNFRYAHALATGCERQHVGAVVSVSGSRLFRHAVKIVKISCRRVDRFRL